MNLWVNNEPAKVYVPPENPKQAYEILQSRLSKGGSIPIGIDHLPDNIIKANPILAKLNLLDVGEITRIKYSTDDTIRIVEAELTNPLLQQLYEAGELDMVSIVAKSTVSECPRGDYDYIVQTTDITRVDIVEKGACPTCNIPKPQNDDDTVVYARYSIQTETEENHMSNELTKEDIKAIFDECIEAKIAPMQEQLNTIIEAQEPPAEPTQTPADDETVKQMEAEIAELKAKTATAKVDNLIASGKILPADKDTNVTLCAREPELFDKLYENSPVLIDLNTKKSLFARDSDDDDDTEPTPEEQNLNSVLAHFAGDD